MYVLRFQTFFLMWSKKDGFFDRKNELEIFHLLQQHHLKLYNAAKL